MPEAPLDPALMSREERHALFAERSVQLTEARWARMQGVASERTRHLCVVLEEIYQGHNASAILRTCDCFGVQDVHAIEARNTFKANDEIALGSSQWLDVHRWPGKAGGRDACVAHLRSKGYLIAATSLGDNVVNLDEVQVDRPIALCFGTEKEGISPELLKEADLRVRIPMHGFTQSFNVSVSAALCLHTLTTRMRRDQVAWRLPEDDRDILLARWLLAQTH